MTTPSADRTDSTTAAGAGPRRRALFLVAAVGAWAYSTFAHGFGTDLAHDFFEWAKAPGRLAAEGGAAGVRVADFLVTAAFVVLGAALVWSATRRVRAMDRDDRRARLLAWALWAAFVHFLWKGCIVFASELVHFGQYALVAGLLHAGMRPGRRAEAAFLVATLLGALDEAWQHWGIAIAIDGILWHGFDWGDLVLNAAGAAGGVLFVATRPGETVADARPGRLVAAASAALAALLLPLLLLGRVALAKLFGSYAYHPTWNEYDIGKAAHWMTPIDGIPLFVASVLFLGRLVSGTRTFVTHGVALALFVLVTLSIDPPSRLAGRPVHEDVPTAAACRVAEGAIVVDGVLDEPAWAGAQRLGPFERNAPDSVENRIAEDAKVPLQRTFARLAWDERALYVAFDVEDRDVWARDASRDDPRLPGDEVVEVFVDPDGDEVTYYEFEWSPAGVAYDLFNYIPSSPADFNPWAQFVGLADWDARDVVCKIAARGTLDVVADWESAGALDEDGGFTAEIAIPWRVFRTTTTPYTTTRGRLPPAPGERWRIGLYRVERPRAAPSDGRRLARNEAERFAQFQAWSPTNRASFHRPERFGVVEFVDSK
jgi:hypothetical protein